MIIVIFSVFFVAFVLFCGFFYCFCSIVLYVFLLCCVICRFTLANKPLITICYDREYKTKRKHKVYVGRIFTTAAFLCE